MVALCMPSGATACARTASGFNASNLNSVFCPDCRTKCFEEFIDYEILGRQEESQRRHEAFEWRLKALRDETQRIEAELKRLAEMIAVGNGSPTIMAAITEREARLRGRSSPGRDQFGKNSMSYAPWRIRPQFMRRGLSWLS